MVVLGALLAASTRLNWRIGVIALKATGQLDTLAWSDLIAMVEPGSGFWLAPLLDSDNPYAVIQNPFNTPQDIRTGKALFRYQCERCHGSAARGGAAPALVGRDLNHGSSDWAVFRTIREGVSGTAMMPHTGLSDEDRWKLVAFIQSEVTKQNAQVATAGTAGTLPPLAVDFEQLRKARVASSDWPTYFGSYNGYRYSDLDAINRNTVSQLQARWIHQLPTRGARFEATPVIAGGRIFIAEPQGGVIALDASTGVKLWRYTHSIPEGVKLCCATANRGVTLLNDAVYVATLDAHLIALDGATGKKLWEKEIADHNAGYSSTGAPLAVKNMIIVGIAGAEFGAPGFIDAYDAKTGKRLWRFNTVPKPGEKGNETWGGNESWRMGGASTWMTGTYDPDLDLLYWGVGNPVPDYDASGRPGDNLYSNCVLAMSPETGKLVWYFQFTPNDDHDWDAVQTPILADVVDGGQTHKLLLAANRNGFFYMLDRTNGKYLRALPYVKQTWAEGIDPTGRPIKRPESSGSERGALVYPGAAGGTNWWPPSYSPAAQLFLVPALERPGVFFRGKQNERKDGGQLYGGASVATNAPHYTTVRALDPLTGKMRWEHRFGARHDSGELAGLLSTAGGIVFTSDKHELVALDMENGEPLWSFQASADIFTPPATYRIDSEQFLVIVAGDVVIGMALPRPLRAAKTS